LISAVREIGWAAYLTRRRETLPTSLRARFLPLWMSSFRAALSRKKTSANYCRSPPAALTWKLPRTGCSTQLSTVSRVAPERDGSRGGDADATLQLSTRRTAPW